MHAARLHDRHGNFGLGAAVRHAARIDENKHEIVKALRAVGCTVYDLKQPLDLLVGLAGQTLLVEIKRPPGPKGGMDGRKHTPAQSLFLQGWNGGPVATVDSVDAALRAVGVLR
jgi:hypothetical protein